MDTRTKIVDSGRARSLAESGVTVVSGYFDPLTSSMAERLGQIKKPGSQLLVLIRTPEDAILPARARAELVAAVACVNYVCEECQAISPGVSLEAEHAQNRAALTQRVHARHKAAS